MIKNYEFNARPEWLKSSSKITEYSFTIPQSMGVMDEETGKLIVKSGTIFPSNDEKAIGIVRNDYNVTLGNVVGSVISHCNVVEKRLPYLVSNDAKEKLLINGIHFYSLNNEELREVLPDGVVDETNVGECEAV